MNSQDVLAWIDPDTILGAIAAIGSTIAAISALRVDRRTQPAMPALYVHKDSRVRTDRFTEICIAAHPVPQRSYTINTISVRPPNKIVRYSDERGEYGEPLPSPDPEHSSSSQNIGRTVYCHGTGELLEVFLLEERPCDLRVAISFDDAPGRTYTHTLASGNRRSDHPSFARR